MSVHKRDVERLYLQAIFSRGVVLEGVAKLLREKCIEAVNAAGDLEVVYDDSDDAWHAFTAKLNASLDKLDLEFKMQQDEDDGRAFYALVNRKSDEVSQLATDYTPAEISFFKAVVEQIMLAPNESYSVSSLAALRELSHLKINVTKAQGEVLLSTFVAKGWLKKSKRGRYSLALRSSLELQEYLKSGYPNEIIECTICSEFLTRGVACTSPNCNVRLHKHCATRYFARPGNRPCPACQAPWPSKDSLKPVGEAAARGEDDMRRRTRARTAGSDEEEAEYSGEEEEEPTQRQPKSKGKGKGKAKKQEDSDEDVEMVDEEEDVKPSQAPRRSSRRQ